MIARKFSEFPLVTDPVYLFKTRWPLAVKPGVFKRTVKLALKMWYNKSIAVKPYNGTSCFLCYEKAQHLMFALKRSVSYEPLIQAKAKRYIQPGDTVFDIGGNIGQYALFFSEAVGDDGKVITFEPDHKNFSFLHFNIHVNDLKNITCLKKGVGNNSGFLQFYRDTDTGGRMGSFDRKFAAQNAEQHTETVAVVTLDMMMEEHGEPRFIKIDVEGFEDNILKGLTKNLKRTDFLIEVREETKDFVFAYFQNKGYTCRYIDNPVDVLITSAAQIPGFANLLFTKSGPR